VLVAHIWKSLGHEFVPGSGVQISKLTRETVRE
jgi:hypothetical protein